MCSKKSIILKKKEEMFESIVLSDEETTTYTKEPTSDFKSKGKESFSKYLGGKVQGQKITSTKRKANWISSSFGGFNQNSFASKSECQGSKLDGNSNSNDAGVSWIDKYRPAKECDLAVHKKKIVEVKQWLLDRLATTDKKRVGNILVLTGPAGTGKSATIDVLSKELNVELQGWNAPVSLTNEEYSNWVDFRLLSTESQRKQFHDFLLRANRYPSLLLSKQEQSSNDGRNKVILVEEIPNVFRKNVKEFHEVLRQFEFNSRNPLVFVLSDSYMGDNNLYTLFRHKIIQELKITVISFNAVAMTGLVKTLSKVATLEREKGSVKFNMPSKDTLELLATSSSGDIRACINSLQFFCTNTYQKTKVDKDALAITSSQKVTKRRKVKTSKKDSSKNEALSVSLCGKDTSLFLFRSLGKILYCKREISTASEKINQLPLHLEKHSRDTLLIDPEVIIEKTHVTSDTLMLYLHQNYLPFFDDIDDVLKASSSLSDADYITGAWSSRDVMKNYSGSLACRGLIFANKHKATTGTGTWRPLHKPKWFDTFKESNANQKAGNELFHEFRHPAAELYIDVLPYLGKINVSLHAPIHISFVEMISRFSLDTHTTRSSVTTEALAECAAEIEDPLTSEFPTERLSHKKEADDQPVSLSQVIADNPVDENEADNFEENLIEDFSDEDDMFFL